MNMSTHTVLLSTAVQILFSGPPGQEPVPAKSRTSEPEVFCFYRSVCDCGRATEREKEGERERETAQHTVILNKCTQCMIQIPTRWR